jgi:hypothetical protein
LAIVTAGEAAADLFEHAARLTPATDPEAAWRRTNRAQLWLAVDPVCPKPAIGLKEGEADIGNRRDPGFDELVADGEGPSLLDDLIPTAGRPPDGEVRRQHEIETRLALGGDPLTLCRKGW